MLENQSLPRDFKGIWIPREIWENEYLSPIEKLIWAEINSLDCPKTGCTASNEYLQKFFKLPERTLRLHLSRLKNLGLISTESFDGRTRILRSSLKTSKVIFDTSARQPIAGPGGNPLPPSAPMNYIEREIKEENKDIDPPPLSPTQSHFVQSVPKREEEDLCPTKEEEKEINKRAKERPSNDPKIKDRKKWDQKVLSEIRAEKRAKEKEIGVFIKHKEEAHRFDGKKINDDLVIALKDRVEFSWGTGCRVIFYDMPDDQWKEQTRKWFGP